MNKENNQKLDKVIGELIDHMNLQDPSSDEYKKCADTLSTLIEKSNDTQKIKEDKFNRVVTTMSTVGMEAFKVFVFVWTCERAWGFEGVATMTNEPGKKAFSLLPRFLLGK